MLWIVQSNLFNEDGYDDFIKSLDRLGSNYKIVKPIPFTNILLEPDFDYIKQDCNDPQFHVMVDNDQPIVAFGATSLTRIAKAQGWKPATFANDNFHYSKWKEGWGENLLNYEAIIKPLAQLSNVKGWNDLFVRPTEDTKSLSGTVMSKERFDDWRDSIVYNDHLQDPDEFTPLHAGTEFVISPPKIIYNECRVFVAGGEVVTASMYKFGDTVRDDANVSPNIIDFVNEMIKLWNPADAFVIDVADTPDGFKVIEMNNFCSSGFYACDTQKIVSAVENLVGK